LLAAGFAPIYADTAWDAAEMGAVKKALERMLRQHSPFPAIVMDRHWNVLMTNDDAPRFFGSFVDMAARKGQRNLLRLIFDAQGMRPHIDNWERVARGLFERMWREAVGGRPDAEAEQLIAELQAMSGFTLDWERADTPADGPVVPIGFIKDGMVLNYFSMVSTVGTPQTVAAQELRVECMFPADDATEAWHLGHFAAT
ncbi:MAG: transcriptional regulator, partial [Burkholderiaceae bacterium]|nr:transcriptional regulator [Burkholderiaceae bacterium]